MKVWSAVHVAHHLCLKRIRKNEVELARKAVNKSRIPGSRQSIQRYIFWRVPDLKERPVNGSGFSALNLCMKSRDYWGLIVLLCILAVVSVDQAAVVGLAAHTTGQPLQIAAQGAAMQQPSYVYQLPPSQVLQQGGQGYPVTHTLPHPHSCLFLCVCVWPAECISLSSGWLYLGYPCPIDCTWGTHAP